MALSANPGPPDEDTDELLECGRPLSEVWGAWDDGTAAEDPHIVACPYCGEALDRLRMLDGFVREARSADAAVTEEDEAAAESVTTRVMDIVRLELRPGRPLPLAEPGGPPEEDLTIMEAAAARMLRSAAESLPGVHAGSCRISLLDHAASAGLSVWMGDGPELGPLRIRLEVAADLSWTVPEVATAVRERVGAAARDSIGMDVRAVDVAVVDVVTGSDDGFGTGSREEAQG